MRASLKLGIMAFVALAAMVLGAGAAWAATEGGYAVRRAGRLDAAATDHMQDINDFHDLLLVIITGISRLRARSTACG